MSNCPCALCSPPVKPSNRYAYDIERAPFTRAMDHGRELERAAIVAWLFSKSCSCGDIELDPDDLKAIERGEHLRADDE